MQIQSSLVKIRNLSKVFSGKFGQIKAFQNISLDVGEGQFVCIVGPSGCGKTTLLRTIVKLESATEGELRINSTSTGGVCETRMVFQEQGLFPWMSVSKNVAITLQNNTRIETDQIDAEVSKYLARVGLEKFAEFYPYQLSGGMRQRVSIARAFANRPDLLLMDEPFVFLDYQTRINLQMLLMTLWEQSRQTVVFVTHDIEEAVLLADKVFVMSAHPGLIKQSIDIDLPRPRERFSMLKNQVYLDLVAEIAALIELDGKCD